MAYTARSVVVVVISMVVTITFAVNITVVVIGVVVVAVADISAVSAVSCQKFALHTHKYLNDQLLACLPVRLPAAHATHLLPSGPLCGLVGTFQKYF